MLEKRKLAAKIQDELKVQEDETKNAKYEGVPAWKRKILEEKERKAALANAPAEEKSRQEKEEQERLAALPEWKRNLIMKKKGLI